MNQVAALLVPTVLPQAAGAVVHAANARAPGASFADILSQFSSLLADLGMAAATKSATQPPIEIAVAAANTLENGAPLSPIVDAAPINDTPANVQAQPQALLGLIAAPAQNAPVTAGIPVDPTLAAQLAAFQHALQTAQTQAPANTQAAIASNATGTNVAPSAPAQLVLPNTQAPVTANLKTTSAIRPAKTNTIADTAAQTQSAPTTQNEDASPTVAAVETAVAAAETPKLTSAKPAAKTQRAHANATEQPHVAIATVDAAPSAPTQTAPQMAPVATPQTPQPQATPSAPIATTVVGNEQSATPKRDAAQLALRGTIPPAQDAAPSSAPAQPQNPKVEKIVADAAANIAATHASGLTSAPAKQTASPAPATAKPLTAPKRATAAAQTDALKQAPSHAPAQTIKTAEPATDNTTTSTATSAQSATTPAATTHKADAGTTPPLTPTPSPVLPSVMTAQQFTAATAAMPQTAVPLDALAVHMARKLGSGSSEFEISLHPAELGKLEISLSVAGDGQVQASIRAERPETLELLQRDSRALEQQLRQAGLDVGSNALSFSLSNGNNGRPAPFTGWPAFAGRSNDDAPSKEVLAANYVAVRVRGGVDIQV